MSVVVEEEEEEEGGRWKVEGGRWKVDRIVQWWSLELVLNLLILL
jgi:hypothetical protein